MADDLVKDLRNSGWYFGKPAADRIEKLEAALREILLWTDDCDECDYDDEWLDIETRARKALEGKDD